MGGKGGGLIARVAVCVCVRARLSFSLSLSLSHMRTCVCLPLPPSYLSPSIPDGQGLLLLRAGHVCCLYPPQDFSCPRSSHAKMICVVKLCVVNYIRHEISRALAPRMYKSCVSRRVCVWRVLAAVALFSFPLLFLLVVSIPKSLLLLLLVTSVSLYLVW